MIAAAAFLLTGCPDPKERFEEFEGNVVDAAVVEPTPDAPPREIPDVTGTFYLGFSSKDAQEPEQIFHIMWKLKLTKNPDGTAKIDVDSQNLTETGQPAPNRQPVGAVTKLKDLPVTTGAQFQVEFVDLVVPGTANPITHVDLTMSMIIAVDIKSENIICGKVVSGMVTQPIPLPLAESTFVGQRVPDGTVGDALPPPISLVCPDVEVPDAGVPDATPADADTTPDAGPDAT